MTYKYLLIACMFCVLQLSAQTKSTHTYAVKDGDSLKLDVYIPQGADTTKTYPALIWMHGGGFAGGQRDVGDEVKLMEYVSTHGYVGVSISYRLLRKGEPTGFGCDCPASEKLNVFKQAAIDYLDAANFVLEHSEQFYIDRSKIVAGGSSAGAESVLSAVYMKEYFLENTESYESLKFAGLISLAGAMVNSNYITAQNALPTVLFHGTADNLVPFATAAHHYCEQERAGYLILDGSETIAEQLKAVNSSYYFHVELDGHHGVSSIPFDHLESIFEFFKQSFEGSKIVQTKIIVEATKHKHE